MSGSRKVLDARGLACPEPVVLTKRAIEEGGFDLLEVLVDGDGRAGNVAPLRRICRARGDVARVEGTTAAIRIRADGAGDRTRRTKLSPSLPLPPALDRGRSGSDRPPLLERPGAGRRGAWRPAHARLHLCPRRGGSFRPSGSSS